MGHSTCRCKPRPARRSCTRGAYSGPITVDAGATLQPYWWDNVTFKDDLTVNGTLINDGGQPTVIFSGATFANNGTVSGIATFKFGRSGTQTLLGTGSFSGGTAKVLDDAVVRRGSGHTMNAVVVNNGGTLDLITNTLGVASYTQGASGTLELAIRGDTPGVDHGRMNVTGAATLSGTLEADFTGFLPMYLRTTLPIGEGLSKRPNSNSQRARAILAKFASPSSLTSQARSDFPRVTDPTKDYWC